MRHREGERRLMKQRLQRIEERLQLQLDVHHNHLFIPTRQDPNLYPCFICEMLDVWVYVIIWMLLSLSRTQDNREKMQYNNKLKGEDGRQRSFLGEAFISFLISLSLPLWSITSSSQDRETRKEMKKGTQSRIKKPNWEKRIDGKQHSQQHNHDCLPGWMERIPC